MPARRFLDHRARASQDRFAAGTSGYGAGETARRFQCDPKLEARDAQRPPTPPPGGRDSVEALDLRPTGPAEKTAGRIGVISVQPAISCEIGCREGKRRTERARMPELPHERAVSPFPALEFRRDAMFPVPVALCRGPVKFQATSSKPKILLACERTLSKEPNRARAVTEAPLQPMATLAGMREIRNSPNHAPILPRHDGRPRLLPLPAFAIRERCRELPLRRKFRASADSAGRKRDAESDRRRLATAALPDGPPLPTAPDARSVPKPMRSAQNLRRKVRLAPIRSRPDLPIPE